MQLDGIVVTKVLGSCHVRSTIKAAL